MNDLDQMLAYQNKQALLKQELANLFVYGIYSFKFYRNSPEEIVSALQKAIGSRQIEADAVHKYQGREKDVIQSQIYSVFDLLYKSYSDQLLGFIKNSKKVLAYESENLTNVLTYTDFMIFSKVDKMPVLVVEVDGYAYHADNPNQLKRDKMKDEILGKKLLRK